MTRSFSRTNDQLRPVTIERGFVRMKSRSVLYRCGVDRGIGDGEFLVPTRCRCSREIDGIGHAEYAMLPVGTSSRVRRGQ